MFPTFISILDIQSWWEVPSIAYFCSLFRAAFNLLDFDIEELEEALLTDGTEDCSNSLLTELIVRLLSGCLKNNEISAFNYQMFLRRLFRQKCQETGRTNPFDSDIDFQFLPLRTKVEILYALCDFRLDSDDVFDLFKNLEADSLRVEPLGWDDNNSAYWYFYGTRLYREDYKKTKGKKKKTDKKKGNLANNFLFDSTERVWQVVCFTEADWANLTEKFKNATSQVEKELYQSLSQNFLPEIPRLFQEKERLQRRRLLELAPRRTSSRVLEKIKRDDDIKPEIKEKEILSKELHEQPAVEDSKPKKRSRSDSVSSEQSMEESIPKPQAKRRKRKRSCSPKEVEQVIPLVSGRKTNNSLSSAIGQISIPDITEVRKNKKKVKVTQIQSQEDIQTDMYKVLEQIIAHEEAWPFMDPVEEEYAPNYYSVIRRPMDLRTIEQRLDSGYYIDFNSFENDFKLIVNNCRLYNGLNNEYTEMVDNLQELFQRLTKKYINRASSSDDEIEIEYQTLPQQTKTRKTKDTDNVKEHHHHHRHHRRHRESHNSCKNKKKDEHKTRERRRKSRNHKHQSRKREKIRIKEKRLRHKHKKTLTAHKVSHKNPKDGHRSKNHNSHKKSEKHLSVNYKSNNSEVSDSPKYSVPSPSVSSIDTNSAKDENWQTSEKNWDTIMNYKKRFDKDKQNLSIPEKDKNAKLRETIEKLKAKNVKLKDNMSMTGFFTPTVAGSESSDVIKKDDRFLKSKIEQSNNDKAFNYLKVSDFNEKIKTQIDKFEDESTSQALEQAVKDIAMWLDDAPSDNFNLLPITTDIDSKSEDIFTFKEEKKPKEKVETKPQKKRDIQRKIERLQPGKSKGNLLSNSPKVDEVKKEVNPVKPVQEDEKTAKLTLGSVLPSVVFDMDIKHDFAESKPNGAVEESIPTTQKTTSVQETENKIPVSEIENKKKSPSPKLSQEKATPNLSAWFKAFGAPKAVSNTKEDEAASKTTRNKSSMTDTKSEITNEDPPEADRSLSPTNSINYSKRRRTSTGSTVSERSSFSQDMDSPHHQMFHNSPLLQSPISPKPDDYPKSAYNLTGTNRVGFYQDTTSVKSSPEKSSPCEGSSSPRTPSALNVYAVSTTPTPTNTYTENMTGIKNVYPPLQSSSPYSEDKDLSIQMDKEPSNSANVCDTPPYIDGKSDTQPDEDKAFQEKKLYNNITFSPKLNTENQLKPSLPGIIGNNTSEYLYNDKNYIAADFNRKLNKNIDYLHEKLNETNNANNNERPIEALSLNPHNKVDMVNLGYYNTELEKVRSCYDETIKYPNYDEQNIRRSITAIKPDLKKYDSPKINSEKQKFIEEQKKLDLSQLVNLQGGTNLMNLPMSSNQIPHTMSNSDIIKRTQEQLLDPNMYSAGLNIIKSKDPHVTSASSLNYLKAYNQFAQYTNQPPPKPVINTSQCELRIPNPRSANVNWGFSMKHDVQPKQKADDKIPSYPIASSFDLTTPYSSHSVLPIETLTSLPNLSQMIETYSTNKKYLSTLSANAAVLHNEALQRRSKAHSINNPPSTNMYSHSPSLDYSMQPSSEDHKEPSNKKGKSKKKTDSKSKHQPSNFHDYPASYASNPKPNLTETSSYNYPSDLSLENGYHPENPGYSLDQLRSSASNKLMAANYMAAAAVVHQRNTAEANMDKNIKPAHQSGPYFPGIMSHTQVRPPYPFGADASSPLYQDYFQEELMRHSGAQIMGLYASDFPGPLGLHQTYDSINRSSWL